MQSFAFNGNSLHLEHDCIFALPLRLSVNHSHTFKVTILRSTLNPKLRLKKKLDFYQKKSTSTQNKNIK